MYVEEWWSENSDGNGDCWKSNKSQVYINISMIIGVTQFYGIFNELKRGNQPLLCCKHPQFQKAWTGYWIE